jgi:hypothetical protein
LSFEYGIQPWDMADLTSGEYAAIADDVRQRDAAAKKAASSRRA